MPVTAPDPPDKTLAVAQRLDYDTLSIIFVISHSEWKTAALTMSSVCRLWRHIALSVPQIWSRIDLDASVTPYNLSIFLERSRPLPLNIFISDKWLLRVLSSVMDRLVCMTISDYESIVPHELSDHPDPARRRIRFAHFADVKALQDISKPSQPPQLREIHISNLTTASFFDVAASQNGFTALQKLEINCGDLSDYQRIVHGASNTLVSLALTIWSGFRSTYPLSFPRLRHLQIIHGGHRCEARLVLDLDAPLLESVEQGFGVGSVDGIEIRLRDPKSVKQLRFECDPLDLTPYPALRKLWITGSKYHNHTMLKSLKNQIASCPDLETILYCDPRGGAKDGEDESSGPSSVFFEILDLVRESGRNITVKEFLPGELDLPGAMQRTVGITVTPYCRD